MKKISSILFVAFMGAGMLVSAQEGAAPTPASAAAPTPKQGNVSRDRVAELMGFDVKLDQRYDELKKGGVATAAGIYAEAKGRISSTLAAIEKNRAKETSKLAFSACSTYVASAFLLFERENNEFKIAKANASRDSLQNVLHKLHVSINRIEGGRAYNLAQELEASRAKSSLLQGDLKAKEAELAAERENLRVERARLRKVMQDAQKQFDELRSAMISVSKDARGTIISMADILFESGKATLKPELEKSLSKIAGILIVYKEPNIVVEGHTDNLAPKNVDAKEYNQKLSEDRANAVRGYLIEQGVADTRLTAVGHAFEKPIADNATKEGRAKNRRVELVIQDKQIEDDGADADEPAPAGK